MNDAILDASKKRFALSYAEARQKFRHYVAEAGVADSAIYKSPAIGPGGEELSTDVAWFGDRRASKVGILISATHGAEGYCGSAAQLDWISEREYERLKPDEAMLLVHAINPYGFACGIGGLRKKVATSIETSSISRLHYLEMTAMTHLPIVWCRVFWRDLCSRPLRKR
ncbi:hypothetical protein ACVWZ6_002579 [Bradyrhizobium sp. GM6.1]